jgi:hypothetical protein
MLVLGVRSTIDYSVMQASAGCNILQGCPQESGVHLVQIYKSTLACGSLESGLDEVLVSLEGQIVDQSMSGHAHFCVPYNFAKRTTLVQNTSVLSD